MPYFYLHIVHIAFYVVFQIFSCITMVVYRAAVVPKEHLSGIGNYIYIVCLGKLLHKLHCIVVLHQYCLIYENTACIANCCFDYSILHPS